MSSSYRHIACCVDRDEMAPAVVREALRLAEGDAAIVTLVHVVAPPGASVMGPFTYIPPPVELRTEAKEWLAALALTAPGAIPLVLDGRPAPEVVDWAAVMGVDLIVAAARRGVVERALLGGFAAYLAYHAPCPVLLLPAPAREGAAGQEEDADELSPPRGGTAPSR